MRTRILILEQMENEGFSGVELATRVVLLILAVVAMVAVAVVAYRFFVGTPQGTKEKGQPKKQKSKGHQSKEAVAARNLRPVSDLLSIDGIYSGMIVQGGGSRFTSGIICFGFDFFSLDPAVRRDAEIRYLNLVRSIDGPISLNSTYHSFDISRQAVKHEEALRRIRADRDRAQDELNYLMEQMFTMDEEGIAAMDAEYRRLSELVEALERQCKHMEAMIAYLEHFTEGQAQQFQDHVYYVSYQCATDEVAEDFDTRVDLAKKNIDTQISNLRNRLQGIGVSCRVLSTDELRVLMYRHYHPSGRNMTDDDIIKLLAEEKMVGYAGKDNG